jgi:hypothetical protein
MINVRVCENSTFVVEKEGVATLPHGQALDMICAHRMEQSGAVFAQRAYKAQTRAFEPGCMISQRFVCGILHSASSKAADAASILSEEWPLFLR